MELIKILEIYPFPDKPWDANELIRNPNIPIDMIIQKFEHFLYNLNPRQWSRKYNDEIFWGELSWNPTVNSEIVQRYLDKPWNWSALSVNPNNMFDLVEKYPDKKWNWYALSMNPNLNCDIIKKFSDKPWNWVGISVNLSKKESTYNYTSATSEELKEIRRQSGTMPCFIWTTRRDGKANNIILGTEVKEIQSIKEDLNGIQKELQSTKEQYFKELEELRKEVKELQTIKEQYSQEFNNVRKEVKELQSIKEKYSVSNNVRNQVKELQIIKEQNDYRSEEILEQTHEEEENDSEMDVFVDLNQSVKLPSYSHHDTLNYLIKMGYTNRTFCSILLKQHNGDIQKVISDLKQYYKFK